MVFNRDSYSRGTGFPRLECFTPETTRDTVALIKAMVEAEQQLERVRDNLRLRRNFDYKKAFDSIDLKNTEYIKVPEVRDFLIGRYLFCTDDEI